MVKTNNIMRILSVLMVVVIVSVTFMQPVAYANALVIGGAALLLMAALLVSCGMIFTSESQLQAAAQHAYNSMPSDLRERLDNVIEVDFGNGGGFNFKPPQMPNILKGLMSSAAVLMVGRDLFLAVKAFIYETFGITPEKFSPDSDYASTSLAHQGIVGIVKTGVSSDGKIWGEPIYSKEFANERFIFKKVGAGTSFTTGYPFVGFKTLIVNDRYVISVGANTYTRKESSWEWELRDYEVNCYDKVTGKTKYGGDVFTSGAEDYFCKYIFYESNGNLCFQLGMSWTRKDGVREEYVSGYNFDLGSATPSNDKVTVSKPAYEYSLSPEAAPDLDHASIVVPDNFGDLVGAPWEEILSNSGGAEKYLPEDVPITPPIVPPPPDIPEPETGSINWKILLNIDVFNKFPFCLPKDVYTFFTVLSAPPKEPVYELDIFNGKFGDNAKIKIDFVMFADFFKLIRSCILIGFVVGMIGATKKYIWTGGG